jgi:hypothetical protein
VDFGVVTISIYFKELVISTVFSFEIPRLYFSDRFRIPIMLTCFVNRIITMLPKSIHIGQFVFQKKETCLQALRPADPQTKEYCQIIIASTVSKLSMKRRAGML